MGNLPPNPPVCDAIYKGAKQKQATAKRNENQESKVRFGLLETYFHRSVTVPAVQQRE